MKSSWVVRICLLFLLPLALSAHPVAQGNIDVTLQETGVEVHLRVANEQIFVAEAFGTNASADSEQMWATHGEYLLRHMRVQADGQPLQGEVIRFERPENKTADGRTDYWLRFHGSATAAHPSRLLLQQDILNEIEFAPGNRWEATYLLRIHQPNGAIEEGYLLRSATPLEISCQWGVAGTPEKIRSSLGRVISAYLVHGITHILGGYDHLLFISALVLAALTVADLAKVITAFTLAHSLTLTLSVLNVVRLPSRLVEPMIAASIVVVAIQNILSPKTSRGWTRLAIAFGFGLFHGLGFAGGLIDTMAGLPGAFLAWAIVAFSLGVELGHSAVVLAVFGIIRGAAAVTPERSSTAFLSVRNLGSALICIGGVVYLIAALQSV